MFISEGRSKYKIVCFLLPAVDLTVVKIRARRKTEAKIIPPTRKAKEYFLEEDVSG